MKKEEILTAALGLAAEHGLGAVSMGMIAERVGVKKPSLYNHFSSKEELTEEMYRYLREKAKANTRSDRTDMRAFFQGKSAYEILKSAVDGYGTIVRDPEMHTFYKVIYSERCRHPAAAKILVEETEKMILATKQLFYAMEVHRLLHFEDPDMSAQSFALTVHAMMDLGEDRAVAGCGDAEKTEASIREYLCWFCHVNSVKE